MSRAQQNRVVEQTVQVPVNLYRTEDIWTPAQALESKEMSLWLINPPIKTSRPGVYMLHKVLFSLTVENNVVRDVTLLDTWLPQDLTLTVSKESALRSPELRTHIQSGKMILLKPGVAQTILSRPEAAHEKARLEANSKSRTGNNADDYYDTLAAAQSGDVGLDDALKPKEQYGTASRAKNNPSVSSAPLEMGAPPVRNALLALSEYNEQTKIAVVSSMQSELTFEDCTYLIRTFGKIEPISEMAYTRMRSITAA